MVFDTRTVDTMKESLAHYFEISCEELVEFIKEAADNTQAKSRGLFNADIFTEEGLSQILCKHRNAVQNRAKII